MKNGKRRSWTTADVRTLKTLARKAKSRKRLSAPKALLVKRRSVWAYRLTLASSASRIDQKKIRSKRLFFAFGIFSDPTLREIRPRPHSQCQAFGWKACAVSLCTRQSYYVAAGYRLLTRQNVLGNGRLSNQRTSFLRCHLNGPSCSMIEPRHHN